MFFPICLLVLCLGSFGRPEEIDYVTLYGHLQRGLQFVDEYSEQINFDGLLGIVLAEAQLLEIKLLGGSVHLGELEVLIAKCEQLAWKIRPGLPRSPRRYQLFFEFLLDPQFWIANSTFYQNSLENLGIYENWDVEHILGNRKAEYQGIATDVCLEEVLENSLRQNNCPVNQLCKQMMFGNRIDEGYLLSHRLLYLQIGIRSKCFANSIFARSLISDFCSLMLKEAKTNEFLNFPQQDIFLEQILCGMEGFSEYLNASWAKRLIEWQTAEGCYRSDGVGPPRGGLIRSANVIEFGCTDHTTGLGLAALALHIRHKLTVL